MRRKPASDLQCLLVKSTYAIVRQHWHRRGWEQSLSTWHNTLSTWHSFRRMHGVQPRRHLRCAHSPTQHCQLSWVWIPGIDTDMQPLKGARCALAMWEMMLFPRGRSSARGKRKGCIVVKNAALKCDAALQCSARPAASAFIAMLCDLSSRR